MKDDIMKLKGKKVMLEGGIFKDVTELTDDDKILQFVLIFDGAEAKYFGIKKESVDNV